MQRSLSAIIEEACKAKKRGDKITILRKNDSMALRMVLGMALDNRVVWDLPEGTPPYKPSEVLVDVDHMLYNYIPKIYNLLKVPNPIFGDRKNHDLKQFRREHMYVQMLEAVHPKDAELMIAVKDKKLPWRGLTARICNEAFGTNMPVGEKDE